MMRSWVLAVDRAEANPVVRELVNAARDGAYWGWAVSLVAAVAVWVGRGLPSPVTAAAAAALMPIGAGLAWLRTWRRAADADPADRRAAAAISARGWLTFYGLAAALIPAAALAAASPVAAVVVGAVVLVALAELAVLTIPIRARARLLARLRIGARAVAGTEDVRVGRALWKGLTMQRVMVSYPAEWAAHRDTRRDDLVERMMWELCGPPPRTPGQAARRPDYASTWDHVNCRLVVERVPSLPRLLAARDFGQGAGAFVLGQTHAEDADATLDGLPVALHQPRNHTLIVGGTQHGKSSGVRAWVVDGLTHGVWPGGVWSIDGKGSGSMAPLIGRQGVHAVAHEPDEWRRVLVDLVAPLVRDRYAELLAWRAGTSTSRPRHPRALLLLDEIQQVLLSCPDLAGVLDTLARQALEAGVILWVITQRPDAKDAVPGAMRDQLLDRVTFGPLSGSGAKMSFDLAGDDWHKALGVAPVPGRALTYIDGAWRLVQAPWLPIPSDVPDAEDLYPPRGGHRAAESAAEGPPPPSDPYASYGPPPPPHRPPGDASRAPEPPSQPATWPPPPPVPRPAADNPPPAPADPVGEIIEDFGESPEYDPGTARRRRRKD
ncbi:hypothetical protein ACQEU6_46335 [Spirillospora sp. CA-108201]